MSHLSYLASKGWNSTTDLKVYLQDVVAAYNFLNRHVEGVDKQMLFNAGSIWCIVNLRGCSNLSRDGFRRCWVDVSKLHTELEDEASRSRFYCSILAPFHQLLDALGVEPVESRLTPAAPHEMQLLPFLQLQMLWQESRFCDIELNVGGELFKAHRLVLAAASAYWKNVFTSNEPTMHLQILDSGRFSKDTLLGVLRYFYTAELPNPHFIFEWLKLAKEWEIPRLVKELNKLLLDLHEQGRKVSDLAI
jgi:hypothetical protein